MCGEATGEHLSTLMAIVLAGTISACSAGEEPVVAAHFRAEFDTNSLSLRLWRDEIELLSFPSSGLQLGTVPALDDSRSYDPFFLEEEVTWQTMSAAEQDSGSSRIRIHFGDEYEAVLTLTEHEPGRRV